MLGSYTKGSHCMRRWQRRLSMEQALQAARLEEEFQIEGWGFVEGGHDLDQANARVRLTASSLLLRMLPV